MDIHLFLQCLSWCAITTTIILFLTGIPICATIFRKRSTADISGIPFLMGFLGGSFWLRYGFLKEDYTMITVNVVGSSLFFCYCVFYLVFADSKKSFGLKFASVIALILGMVLWVQFTPNIDILGVVCMTFNIINFGAPLAGLKVVLRKKCCDSLPLPMCFFNLLVSAQWFLYGNIVHDSYIMTPNGIGMALAVIQLSLFIIYPRQEQEKSIFQRFRGTVCCLDPEQGECKKTKTIGTNTVHARPLCYKPDNSSYVQEKRLSVGFLEGCKEHPQMRSRTNSVPEVFKDKLF